LTQDELYAIAGEKRRTTVKKTELGPRLIATFVKAHRIVVQLDKRVKNFAKGVRA
jgi:hypothetical protein